MDTNLLVPAAGVVLLIAYKFWSSRPKTPLVEIKRLVDEGAELLDVRSKPEFSSGAIPGAKNIPVGELGARMKELSKEKPIVVYCLSGARSGMARRMLRAAGYADVHDLGAMRNWH